MSTENKAPGVPGAQGRPLVRSLGDLARKYGAEGIPPMPPYLDIEDFEDFEPHAPQKQQSPGDSTAGDSTRERHNMSTTDDTGLDVIRRHSTDAEGPPVRIGNTLIEVCDLARDPGHSADQCAHCDLYIQAARRVNKRLLDQIEAEESPEKAARLERERAAQALRDWCAS